MRFRLLWAVPPVVLSMLAAAVPPAHAASGRCSAGPAFRCAWLTVPLDRTGHVPGTVRLRYAVSREPARGPVLLALSGGPGQSSVGAARSFAYSLSPLLRRHRLAVIDQRGTGASGVLHCPSVQSLSSLDPVTPEAVGACAERLGPRRAFYTTADTVLDLDALRARLGVARMGVMGISYGTHVALQYARTFPAQTERLVLDSIVGPDGPDPFGLDTYRNLPRVLREQCARGACRGITSDPVGDVAALAARLARGPVAGRIPDRHGRLRRVAYRRQEEAAYLLIAGDLNPFLQASLPAALAAARRGDDAPLLRLRRAAAGPRTAATDLSVGLNVTTGCTDGGTPYPLSTPPAERRAAVEARLAAVPPGDYAPFDTATVLASGYGDDCLLWPQDAVRAPSSAPLPDVPALLLGGGADLRTPVENAEATAAQLPHAAVVRVAGVGHDVLDSDWSGCALQALGRFAAGRSVGTPCAKARPLFPLTSLPPRSLRAFRPTGGPRGRSGRALSAVMETLGDAQTATLQDLFAGLPMAGGGLRGGSYGSSKDGDVLVLDRYVYLRGLRVSGRIDFSTLRPRGTLRVSGLVRGQVRFRGKWRVVGVLGGRRVRANLLRSGKLRAAAVGSRRDARSLATTWAAAERVRARVGDRMVLAARP